MANDQIDKSAVTVHNQKEEAMPRRYASQHEQPLSNWFANVPNLDAQAKADIAQILQRSNRVGAVQLGDLWRDRGFADSQDPPAQNTPSTNPRLRHLTQTDWDIIAEAFARFLREDDFGGAPAGRWSYRPGMPHSCCTCTACCAVVVSPKSVL
jgi:hypothetical protein